MGRGLRADSGLFRAHVYYIVGKNVQNKQERTMFIKSVGVGIQFGERETERNQKRQDPISSHCCEKIGRLLFSFILD